MKTRMHEILGVEPGEMFSIINSHLLINEHDEYTYFVDVDGIVYHKYGSANRTMRPATATELLFAINNGIIRRPRYTPKQAEVLKALKVIGYADGFLTKDSDGTVFAHKTKPYKGCEEWLGSKTYSFIPGNMGLVSWYDDEPLSIAQALLDAGVD